MKKILAYLILLLAILPSSFFDFPTHASAVAQDIQYTITDSGSPVVDYYNVKDNGNKVFNWNVDVHSNGPGGAHVVTIGAYDEVAGSDGTTKHPFPVTSSGKTSYAEGESGSFSFSYDTARDSRLAQCGRVQIDGSFINETSPTYDDSNLFFAMVVDYGVDCAPDNQKPVITLHGSNPVNIFVGDSYVDVGATANDPEDGDITAHIVQTGAVNTVVAGTYTLSYDVSDSQGLTADTVTRDVLVHNRDHVNIPPTANAGPDQNITLPISSATLDGSLSTDSDGTLVSYVWTFVSGPLNIDPSDIVKPDISGLLLEGTYHFKLTVTDNSGATADDGVSVVVHPVIIPPLVTAVLLTKEVKGGDAVPSDFQLQIDSVNAVQDSFINVTPGMHTIGEVTSHVKPNYDLEKIVCQDYAGPVTNTDPNGVMHLLVLEHHQYHCVITNVYIPANLPPVANAGTDRIITLPVNSVVLDGSGSTDPDGTITSYAWDFVSGPSTITPLDGVTSNVTGLITGTYVFKLTVMDNDGAIDEDSVAINVVSQEETFQCSDTKDNDGDNKIDALDPGCHTDGNVNNENSYDPNDDDETDVFSNTCPLPDSLTDTTQENINNNGERTLQNVLNDKGYNLNAQTDQKQYQLWNVDANSKVVVRSDFLNGISAQTAVFGYYTDSGMANFVPVFKTANITGYESVPMASAGPFTLNTGAASTIGFAIKYFNGDTLIGVSATLNSLSTGGDDMAIVYNPSSNKYVIAFEDWVGGDFDYNDLVVEVTLSCEDIITENNAPIADAGPDKDITLPTTNSAPTNTSATDSDGTITSTVWSFVYGPGPTPTITNGSTLSPSFTGMTSTGTYVFKLVVTDNDGATDEDMVSVVVHPVVHTNDSPNADAGPDQIITLPVSSTTLDGSASTDPDGTIVSYVWTFVSGPSTINPNDTETSNISGLIAGPYVFKLAVTDNDGATDEDEVTITVNPIVVNPKACSDNRDNDGDNLIDALDPGCHSDGDVNNSTSYVPTDNDETNTTAECGDGMDNTDPEDTLIDSRDPGCHKDGDVDNTESYNPNDTSEVDIVAPLPQCSDGIDNDKDKKIDARDPGCHTDGDVRHANTYDPSDNNERNVSRGGGGSSGGRIAPPGQVLGEDTSCGIYVEKYLRVGYHNDVNSVIKVQNFLNNYMNAGLKVDGIYGRKTEKAVENFQLAHAEKVLKPWGIDHKTGIFYLTTQTEVNNIMCPPLNLPIPSNLVNFTYNANTPPPIVGYNLNL